MTGIEADLVATLAVRIQEEVRRAGLGPGYRSERQPSRAAGDLESSTERITRLDTAEDLPAEDARLLTPPTVFVTWAHRDESWTDEEAQEWERTIAEFATVLRQLGIESDVDLYHLDEAGIDWTRFGPQAIISNDFVLIAISSAWSARWSGTNNPKVGAGAAAEADMLKGLFQQDQAAFQKRTQVVLLPGRTPSDIPPDLSRLVRHVVDPSDADTVLPLIRALTGQPRYPVPPLGSVPVLPPTLRRPSTEPPSAQAADEFGDLLAAVEELRARLKSSRGVRRSELAQKLAALEGILDAISQA